MGAVLRAKCMHIASIEYNSRYFYSKDLANAESKAMKVMILDDGEDITDISKIAAEQVHFYKEVYDDKLNHTKLKIKEANRYFFYSNIELLKLDEDNKDVMHQPITIDELGRALQDLNNKSP